MIPALSQADCPFHNVNVNVYSSNVSFQTRPVSCRSSSTNPLPALDMVLLEAGDVRPKDGLLTRIYRCFVSAIPHKWKKTEKNEMILDEIS